MKHLGWRIVAALGLAALGMWRQEKRRTVRMSPYLRERVNAAVDEVEALSNDFDTATGSIPERRAG